MDAGPGRLGVRMMWGEAVDLRPEGSQEAGVGESDRERGRQPKLLVAQRETQGLPAEIDERGVGRRIVRHGGVGDLDLQVETLRDQLELLAHVAVILTRQAADVAG